MHGRLWVMTMTLSILENTPLAMWIAASKEDYAKDLLRSGDSIEEAAAHAAESIETYFPEGRPAGGHFVYAVMNGSEVVGFLWIGPHPNGPSAGWWVWDIAINEEHRGRGYGRETMLLAEDQVKAMGGHELGLNVFGFNTVARGLYESLGYETVAIRMSKKLAK